MGPAALPLCRRMVGPVLRSALQSLEAAPRPNSDAAAAALSSRVQSLREVEAAIPKGRDTLPLEALFSATHRGFAGLCKRYGSLPGTGFFTGGGVHLAFPVVRLVNLPPTTSNGEPWQNLESDPTANRAYAVRSANFATASQWRTVEDWSLGRTGKYALTSVPRRPLPPGWTVVALDPGVSCPVFANTGVYLFSEDWHKGRRWRAGARAKRPGVLAAEKAMSNTVSRAIGQLEYLHYVELRAQVPASPVPAKHLDVCEKGEDHRYPEFTAFLPQC